MAFLSRLAQIPIEIALSLLFPLLNLFWSMEMHKYKMSAVFIFVLCLFLSVLRRSSFHPKMKRILSILIGLCGLFVLCYGFRWLSDNVVVCLLIFSFLFLMGCFGKGGEERFCLIYRYWAVDFVKALVCLVVVFCIAHFVEEVVVNVSMGPDDGNSSSMIALSSFLLCFSFLQTKKEEERMPILYDPGLWLNAILAFFSLSVLLCDVFDMYRGRMQLRTIYSFSCVLFFLSAHFHLITIRKSPRAMQMVLRIVNAFAILFLGVSFLLLWRSVNWHVLHSIDVFLLVIIGVPMLILHVFLFYKVRWSLKKIVLLGGILALPAISYYLIQEWRISVKENAVEKFAQKYHMLDERKKYQRIGRKLPPIEAIQDPEFPQFMETRKYLYLNVGCRYDVAIPDQYSISGDSVYRKSVDGRVRSFSFEEWNSKDSVYRKGVDGRIRSFSFAEWNAMAMD